MSTKLYAIHTGLEVYEIKKMLMIDKVNEFVVLHTGLEVYKILSMSTKLYAWHTGLELYKIY